MSTWEWRPASGEKGLYVPKDLWSWGGVAHREPVPYTGGYGCIWLLVAGPDLEQKQKAEKVW